MYQDINTARSTRTIAALLLAVLMALVVGSALLFEYVGGYMPCKLCLEQRMPYYIGIPLMLFTALGSRFFLTGKVVKALFALACVLMLYNAYLGVFHAGVEWSWWIGPSDCGAVTLQQSNTGAGVLDALDTVIPPSCDKAALRILGLSMAGWNAIASVILALIALRGATTKI